MSKRWYNHFLALALVHARMSKDPNTRVGAVIVGPDREIISSGFNGFPRGIKDTRKRLDDRDEKLRLIIHAEMNAIVNAARIGVSVKGCDLYLAATDDSGEVWGGPPCTRCTVHIIQAGIRSVLTPYFKRGPSRWADDIAAARLLLAEARVGLIEGEPPDPPRLRKNALKL
jgi:dCMP deaminase